MDAHVDAPEVCLDRSLEASSSPSASRVARDNMLAALGDVEGAVEEL